MNPTGLREIRAAALRALDPDAAAYYQAVAGDHAGPIDPDRPDAAERDAAAWAAIDLLPRYLRGITEVETAVQLGGLRLSTPIVVCPTASHGLAHADGEIDTAAGTRAAGALYIYSNSATRPLADVGEVAGPWWAQLYLLADRSRSQQYLDEARAAGATAIVFTVDYGGRIGWSRFRSTVQQRLVTPAGAYPDLGWHGMSTAVEQALGPDDIAWVAENSRLPVWVKGILHPDDAIVALDAGASGVIVSNHGRRQLDGVISTARALPAVVAAVDGRVPIMVDGGVRSGADVLRAIALGADLVGIGRPALWGLTVGGADGVRAVLDLLTEEFGTAMASAGVSSVDQLDTSVLAP